MKDKEFIDDEWNDKENNIDDGISYNDDLILDDEIEELSEDEKDTIVGGGTLRYGGCFTRTCSGYIKNFSTAVTSLVGTPKWATLYSYQRKSSFYSSPSFSFTIRGGCLNVKSGNFGVWRGRITIYVAGSKKYGYVNIIYS